MEAVRLEKQLIQFCGQKWSRLKALTAYPRVLAAIKQIYHFWLFLDMPQEFRYTFADLKLIPR